ncbi:MAG: ABC transporter permease [Bacteroidales bacterium]|nr:ABC transporter permease [Bacteroidales bacterium]
MRKILILALREFNTAVRTRSFIIGLVIAPVLMFGSIFAINIFKDKVNIDDKKIVVIDHTGLLAQSLIEAAEMRNRNEIFDTETKEQVKPAYLFEIATPDTVNPFQQKLELSDKIRNKKLHAFIEIGPDVIHPGENAEASKIKYYSENSLMDDIRGWINNPLNNRIRQLRITELNLDAAQVQNLFHWHNAEGLGLVSNDAKTGNIEEAKESSVVETIFIPYFLLMLMFMIVLLSAVPLLSAVMEEKIERIAEVLLGSVTPFQFLMGKVLGGISISLAGSAIYLIGGAVLATRTGYVDSLPWHVIPWFIVYMLLNVVMIGSIMAALGSACNDNKDAQSLQFPAMLPIILPMFLMMPVIQDPLSSFSTGLSLFPLFTPMLMILRLASPVTIPLWQPFAGLAGVILFTVLFVWLGGKIFRTFILLQGKRPSLPNLIRYAFRK